MVRARLDAGFVSGTLTDIVQRHINYKTRQYSRSDLDLGPTVNIVAVSQLRLSRRVSPVPDFLPRPRLCSRASQLASLLITCSLSTRRATVLHRVKRVDRRNLVDRGRAEARDIIGVIVVGRYSEMDSERKKRCFMLNCQCRHRHRCRCGDAVGSCCLMEVWVASKLTMVNNCSIGG